MRPAEVLDLQGTFAAQLTQPVAQEYLRFVAASIADPYRERDDDVDDNAMRVGDRILDRVRTAVQAAHTFHVQPDMTDVVQWASTQLDDFMPYRLDLLPTQIGFAYFDNPLIVQDIRGMTNKIHALVWAPGEVGLTDSRGTVTGVQTATILYQFTDITDPDDITLNALNDRGIPEDVFRRFGRLHLFHWEPIFPGERLGPPTIPPEAARVVHMDPSEVHESTNTKRLFVAYLRLLGQTLVKSSPATIDRHATKRAKRRGLPARVVTVALRRVEYVGEERGETNVEWSHRWLVRGHWRRQPCGPKHPLAEPDGKGGHVAVIWIDMFVKGPEGAPLVIRDHVYDLSR